MLRGKGVNVAVGDADGATAAVNEDAAFAVCTMNVLIALGSVVGKGVATDGAHARIRIKATDQINSFRLRIRRF